MEFIFTWGMKYTCKLISFKSVKVILVSYINLCLIH